MPPQIKGKGKKWDRKCTVAPENIGPHRKKDETKMPPFIAPGERI